ncbi:hypothetical protein ACTJKT_01370 [Pseudomonas sp. 22526]|uniref:hypothetical protein n=1 Tax=Pseudomonas sp. 22526 TaxID=3453937 RepID=UPI003F83D42A
MKNVNLVDVCENAKRILLEDPTSTENRAAIEVLASYAQAAESGELNPERLGGFLHGLATVGTITTTAWIDLKEQLVPTVG